LSEGRCLTEKRGGTPFDQPEINTQRYKTIKLSAVGETTGNPPVLLEGGAGGRGHGWAKMVRKGGGKLQALHRGEGLLALEDGILKTPHWLESLGGTLVLG